MDQALENKSDLPKISIMLCTYNRADLISFAIDSILAQTFQDWELLILDDASTDDTENVVKKYGSDQRIRYIKHLQNLGITKNRNVGLKEARGKYIAVLDSDDVWLDATKLEKQVEFLENNFEYVLVGTEMIIINNEGKELKRISYALDDGHIRNSFLIRNQIAQSSILYRKEAALQVGGYDEMLPIWEDWDLWLKLGTIGKIKNISVYGLGYRQHGKNISSEDKRKGVHASLFIISRHKKEYPNYWLGTLKLHLKLWLLVFNF